MQKWKRVASYLIVIGLGYLMCVLCSNKFITLSLMNATDQDEIEIRYSIDDWPVQIESVERSAMAFKFYTHATTFGKHTIRVNCKELNISKTIEVFTFKNNYLDFEIQNQERGPEIQSRYSWFPLVYM